MFLTLLKFNGTIRIIFEVVGFGMAPGRGGKRRMVKRESEKHAFFPTPARRLTVSLPLPFFPHQRSC